MKAGLKLLATSVMALTTTTAIAETGWYVGVGGGQSKTKDWYTKGDVESLLQDEIFHLNGNALDGELSSGTDDTDIGYKIFGGYQFGKYFALEVSYIDLGESTASSRASGYFYSDYGDFEGSMNNKLSFEAEAFTVDTLLTLPMADVAQFFFKVGVYRADATERFTVAYDLDRYPYNASGSFSDTSTGVHLGLGVDVKLTEKIALRAEWERLDEVEIDELVVKRDIDLLSASLIYNF